MCFCAHVSPCYSPSGCHLLSLPLCTLTQGWEVLWKLGIFHFIFLTWLMKVLCCGSLRPDIWASINVKNNATEIPSPHSRVWEGGNWLPRRLNLSLCLRQTHINSHRSWNPTFQHWRTGIMLEDLLPVLAMPGHLWSSLSFTALFHFYQRSHDCYI